MVQCLLPWLLCSKGSARADAGASSSSCVFLVYVFFYPPGDGSHKASTQHLPDLSVPCQCPANANSVVEHNRASVLGIECLLRIYLGCSYFPCCRLRRRDRKKKNETVTDVTFFRYVAKRVPQTGVFVFRPACTDSKVTSTKGRCHSRVVLYVHV